MSISSIFLLIIHWLHIMAAAIWIGTNIVQMILSKPNANVIEATRQKGDFQKVGKVFKPLVDLCIIVLIATGAIIVFNRLTSNYITDSTKLLFRCNGTTSYKSKTQVYRVFKYMCLQFPFSPKFRISQKFLHP